MTPEEYVQLRAFARYDGLLLALLWTLIFACYIIGMSNATMSLIAVALVFSVPVVVGIYLKHFRDNACGGVISFRRGWAYVAMSFFYAALLFALVQYAYFAYLDHGYFMQMIRNLLDDPVNQQALSQYASKDTFDQMLSDMQSVRPIDLALSMLQANIFIGILLGLPLAGMMKSRKKPTTNQ